MKVTEKIIARHDKLLEKLREEMFYEGFATVRPTRFINRAKFLGDIYAYFMRYDVEEESIMENGVEIPIPRSEKSEDDKFFETVTVPELKKIRIKNSDVFFSGMTALENNHIPKNISPTTLATIAWNINQHVPRVIKVKHRENTFIAYNKFVEKHDNDDIIIIECPRHGFKVDNNSCIYVFEGEGSNLEFLGKYKYKSRKEKNDKDYRLTLSPISENNTYIVEDYISSKTNIHTERFYRDSKKHDESIRRAKGKCENTDCINKAPFKNDDGEVFLESHHIVFLSDNGQDELDNMIALCPNCHREAHHGRNRDILKKNFLQIVKNKHISSDN